MSKNIECKELLKNKPKAVYITRNFVVVKYHDYKTNVYRRKAFFNRLGFYHLLNFAIVNNHAKLSSIWHSKSEPKAKKLVKCAFKLGIPVYATYNRQKIKIDSYKQALRYLKETSNISLDFSGILYIHENDNEIRIQAIVENYALKFALLSDSDKIYSDVDIFILWRKYNEIMQENNID